MANDISTAEELAQEVADLLRHDNIDARIYHWIGLAYNDVLQRVPSEILHTHTMQTVADTEYKSDEISAEVGNVVAAIFVNATADDVYYARYVTPADFDRITSTGAAIAAAVMPQYWTIRNDTGTDKVFITPPASGITYVHLIWSGNYTASPPTNTTQLDLPYHFEHVLVWGAAAIGATILRTPMFPVYEAEYQQAIDDMVGLIGYKPDSTPVLRSIKGALDNTPRMMAPPRFPQTIS